MKYIESETVELKSIYVEDIKKEIIAFANCAGGKLYVGINDNGEVVGVNNADDIIQRITNSVRTNIKPDITMFIHYDTIVEEGKNVVVAEIQTGTNKPYYLAAKGLRPEGVFVRQGTSSVPASDAMIRQMIKATDGDNYEDMRSLEQELTFNVAQELFAKRNVDFGEIQKQTLGLIGKDGQYTNLGLLLSDQCPHIIKAATFAGVDQDNFQNRHEFTGSLLKQIEDAYSFLDMCNEKNSTFEGLLRIDHPSYPEKALREALLNAVVHRDYAFSAATLISVYQDRVEMISVGGLVPGISIDDILMGLSICRNRKLAEIFYRLQLIEAYGTGMKKIRLGYADYPVKPEVKATSGAFQIILPSLKNIKTTIKDTENKDEINTILSMFESKEFITRSMVEEKLGISSSTASRLLKKMVEEKLIVGKGKARGIKYYKG